jgi:hypothetical protein
MMVVRLFLAAQDASRHEQFVRLVILLSLVPSVFGLLLLIARIRDFVPGMPHVLPEAPEDIHPVELAILWSTFRKHYAPRTAYRTEIIHLASDGVIRLEAIGTVSDPLDFRLTLERATQTDIDMQPSALDVEFIDYMFPGPGSKPGDSVLLSDLRKEADGRERLAKWWGDAFSGVRTLLTRILNNTRVEWAAACALGLFLFPALIASAAPDYVITDSPASLSLMAGGVAWLFTAWALPARLPQDLRARMAAWRAFRRFVRRFPSLRDTPAAGVVLWGDYLDYAVALGVAHHVERQIRGLSAVSAPWRGAPSGRQGAAWVRHVLRRGPRTVPLAVRERFPL